MDLVKFYDNKIKKLESIVNKLQVAEKEIEKEVPKRIASEYMEIARAGVQAFYEDYTPLFYDRTYQLYNAYTVDTQPNKIPDHIRFTTENMQDTHRVSNEYVLDTSLRLGYHGGADIGMGYKWGIRFASKVKGIRFVGGGQYRDAYKSESPMKMINAAIQQRHDMGFQELVDDVTREVLGRSL